MWALAVKGMALETQLEDLALAPIDLSEVEQQLAGTDLTSYEAYMVGGGPPSLPKYIHWVFYTHGICMCGICGSERICFQNAC